MESLTIALILIAATLGIGWLCWIWMRASRASQQRMETNDLKIIGLLEEQNRLLRSLLERNSDRV